MSGALAASLGLHSVVGAFASASEKGRRDNEPGASWMGNNRAGQARQKEGHQKMVVRASDLEGEKFSPPTKFSPEKGPDKELKAEFSALILPFPDKVLADAADCSTETVKCWKAERSFPHGRHLMKLVADFPKIRAWHDRRTGAARHPQSQAELFAELERIMASDTAQGRAMRARFMEIVREKG